MINAVSQMMNQKTIDQYKIIEDRYITLKRYLRLYCEKHTLMSSEEIEMIINALEDEPITTTTKLYAPDGEVIEEREEEYE